MNISQIIDEASVHNGYDLAKKYAEFNAKYFSGELPTDIILEFGKIKGAGGAAFCKIVRNGPPTRFNKYANCSAKPGTMRIRLSSTFEKSEVVLDGLLLHEMAHVYFYNIADFKEAHGYKFMSLIRTLSEKSGINVPRTDSSADLELSDKNVKNKQLFVVLFEKEGRTSITLLSPNFVANNKEEIFKRYENVARYSKAKLSLYFIENYVWTKMAAI